MLPYPSRTNHLNGLFSVEARAYETTTNGQNHIDCRANVQAPQARWLDRREVRRRRQSRNTGASERGRSAEHSLCQPDSSFIRKYRFAIALDLIEIRQRLIALRSLHSHDQRFTSPINRLMAQIGHLKEPESSYDYKKRRTRRILFSATTSAVY